MGDLEKGKPYVWVDTTSVSNSGRLSTVCHLYSEDRLHTAVWSTTVTAEDRVRKRKLPRLLLCDGKKKLHSGSTMYNVHTAAPLKDHAEVVSECLKLWEDEKDMWPNFFTKVCCHTSFYVCIYVCMYVCIY